jgi:hypothetical protein
MRTYVYDGYIQQLNKRFNEAMSEIEAHHNFEYGIEFEVAFCTVLRRVLPHKYGICRGFVVDMSGDVAGDDIIIYDRFRFPTIRSLDEDYSRHERLPIEAVYAYIEAKHTLQIEGESDSSIKHAISQVAKVRQLCEKRNPVQYSEIRPYMSLPKKTFRVEGPADYPPIINPLFTMLLSRQVRLKDKSPVITTSQAVLDGLRQNQSWVGNGCDVIVIGKNVLVVPVIPHQPDPASHYVSPFFIPGKSRYDVFSNDELAWSVGLCMLLSALDWIQLDRMPWNNIIADACKKE